MRNLLISFLFLSFSSLAIAEQNPSLDPGVVGLYEEFSTEMGKFQKTKMPITVLEIHYNRVSKRYLNMCKANFNNSSDCNLFNQTFDAWFFNDGGGRFCKMRTCFSQ